jgi:hypothetical protein
MTWNPVGVPTIVDLVAFSDNTVAPVSTYQYRVYAFNGNGNSQFSNIAEVTTPDVPPTDPSDLVATNVTPAQVDLAWTDNSGNEDGFIVQRSTDGGTTWSEAGQTVADVAVFSDTTVIPGGSYLYQVYAFNANGNSSPSNTVQADVLNVVPADPTDLVATSVASTQVDLAWIDNSNNEDGFRVERSDDGGGTWGEVGTTAANVTSFGDTGLASGTGYMYRVYTFNAVGDSANPAGPITVTTTSGTPPVAPSNLLVTNRTQSSLTITWADNSSSEDGFIVQIATDKSFSQSLQEFTVGPDVTTFTFYPLAPNQKYYMRVAAFNGAGYSIWTVTISDKTLK